MVPSRGVQRGHHLYDCTTAGLVFIALRGGLGKGNISSSGGTYSSLYMFAPCASFSHSHFGGERIGDYSAVLFTMSGVAMEFLPRRLVYGPILYPRRRHISIHIRRVEQDYGASGISVGLQHSFGQGFSLTSRGQFLRAWKGVSFMD